MPRNLTKAERSLIVRALQHKAGTDRAALHYGPMDKRTIRQFEDWAASATQLASDIEQAREVSLLGEWPEVAS